MAADEDRDGLQQRSRRGLVDEIGANQHETALRTADRLEREVVVAVDEARFGVEDGLHDRASAAAAADDAAPDLTVEDDDTAPIADLVGDECNRGDGVDSGVETRQRPDGCAHEPARVEQTYDVSVLFDAVLIAHRPAESLRSRAS